jgi:hypothetical protein
MEDASGEGRSTGHRSGLEAAAEEAERNFLAARQAWHAEHGDTLPPRERMTGLPKDAPQSVREAERRYVEARDAWWNVRDQWLVNWGREPRSGD